MTHDSSDTTGDTDADDAQATERAADAAPADNPSVDSLTAAGGGQGILTPDDLDITNDEHVTQLDDDRFLISTDGPAPDEPATDADSVPDLPDTTPDAPYYLHVTGDFDDTPITTTMSGDSPVDVLSDLLALVIHNVDGIDDPETALHFLLDVSPYSIDPSALTTTAADDTSPK